MKCWHFMLIASVIAPLYAEQCKQLRPDIQQALEQALDNIYHLDTQDIQDIVQQDFGCIPEISAQKLLERQQQETDLLVINVLSEYWYEDCHIADSINVPLKQLIYVMADVDRSQQIVVYCALDACDAGQKAYVLLRCMGFDNVVDYPGGIKEWFQLGYAIEGPCSEGYLHDKEASKAICAHTDQPVNLKEYVRKTAYMRQMALDA